MYRIAMTRAIAIDYCAIDDCAHSEDRANAEEGLLGETSPNYEHRNRQETVAKCVCDINGAGRQN
jgi:hypothetical protein